MFDLRVWLDVEGDGTQPTTTPGKGKSSNQSQMQRLGKLAKEHRNGQIPKVDWLDRLTFREIEMINETEKRKSEFLYLMIEFPTICVEDKTVSGDWRFFVLVIEVMVVSNFVAVFDCLLRAGWRQKV